jgi:hypothetical protein
VRKEYRRDKEHDPVKHTGCGFNLDEMKNIKKRENQAEQPHAKHSQTLQYPVSAPVSFDLISTRISDPGLANLGPAMRSLFPERDAVSARSAPTVLECPLATAPDMAGASPPRFLGNSQHRRVVRMPGRRPGGV